MPMEADQLTRIPYYLSSSRNVTSLIYRARTIAGSQGGFWGLLWGLVVVAALVGGSTWFFLRRRRRLRQQGSSLFASSRGGRDPGFSLSNASAGKHVPLSDQDDWELNTPTPRLASHAPGDEVWSSNLTLGVGGESGVDLPKTNYGASTESFDLRADPQGQLVVLKLVRFLKLCPGQPPSYSAVLT
jgi:LPXTG-motif cell wall-anchored protein